jgi:hypothetical protein
MTWRATMARKKEGLKYEPMYKPRPPDKEGGGWWAAVVRLLTFGRKGRKPKSIR